VSILDPITSLTADAKNRIGTVFHDRWTLNRLLGVGGTAAVYEAAEADGSLRALKIVHDDLLQDERVLQRLQREAEVVQKLAHPGIVPIYEVGQDASGRLFLVLELLQGHSMDHVRRSLGKLSASHLKWVAAELLHVVATAHTQGVLHRDIKPSNLFLTRDGLLKVLDFGIARSQTLSNTRNDAHPNPVHTVEGSVLGTPTFMSPEQARGRWSEVDERSDIWAVGATLFTLASGRPVHEARNSTEALGLAMTSQARSLGELVPTLDPALIFSIDQALRYQPSERWPSAKAMYSSLTSGPYTSIRPPRQCLDLVQSLESSAREAAPESDPSLRTTIGHSRVGRERAAASALSQSGIELAPEGISALRGSADGARVSLLNTTYWELFELTSAQVLLLVRSATPARSMVHLRQENLMIIERLHEGYQGWGSVVDMRKAPSRNDKDFEAAMQPLRHRMSARFSRISVLVSSAAGRLQVSRIDRHDGTKTHITQSEPDALRYASGQ
jgi:serine/threonine-protein kinase